MNLIEKHKPIIKLHPYEKYFPIGWNEWFARTKKTTPLPDGQRGRHFPKDKNGNDLPKDFAKLGPTQALYHMINNSDGSIDIAYMYLFAWNGSKRLMGLAPTGAHSADVESFYVHILPNGQVGFYGLTTHGEIQMYNVHPSIRKSKGGPYDNSQTLEMSNGRPVVYSAVNAHAFYDSPGSYFRFYGFGNDNTEDGPSVPFFYENAMSSPAWHDMSDLGMKYGLPSVLSLQMQLFQQEEKPFHLQTVKPHKLYRKVIPHFFSLKKIRFAMWLPYLIYFVLPVAFMFLSRSKHKKKIAFAILILQIYGLKAFFYFFGSSIGIPQDEENIWGFVFPLRFY